MTSEHNPVIGDATLTASGIAQLANVGRAAVSNWRRRYADFPVPVGGTPASPSFNARDVEEWLRRQGKLHQAATEQWAWRHIESYQPAAQIGDALGIAGAYLLARAAQPAARAGLLTPKQLTTQLRAIDRELATLVGRVLPDQWGPQLTTILRTVDQLAQEQDPEAAFEFLHNRYVTSAQSMSGLAGTPDQVADIMLAIAGPGTHTLDFTCGTGSILRMAADRALATGVPTRYFAQEIKPQYALIALLRLWFVHHRGRRAGQPVERPELRIDDSMLADAFPDLRADVVVANFPFGLHDWGHDQLAYDPRWGYGLPPRTEPELAWVQHALAHLAPGGTAVVLMPPAAALRPAGRRIRAELVRRGALRAVIALRAGLMPPVGIGLHIWVLTQPDDPRPNADRILFVNAAVAGPLTELISEAWHSYRTGQHQDNPGVHRTVAAVEILDEQVDLTPQRYLPPPDGAAIDPDHTIAAIGDLDRLLAGLRHGLPAVQPATATAPLRSAPQAALADLIRSGSVAVLRSPNRTRTTTSEPVNEATRVRPGDILIPVVGRDFVARVATTDEELQPDFQALRVDPDRFDPWFVAGALSRRDNIRAASRTSTGGTPRIDPKRLTIPVLALHEQQQYGRAFRQLADFRAALEHAGATGAALSHAISEGLTSGTLTPN
ncbi:type II restriction endonuclease subunit M [Dactylosporangium sucinum]|uniref:Type II restriction endonuclease subunit M n=1 Tax=Dactylosporangium sucinum TaxID=1424081 RepID=A0A917U8H6_9ACTN|nr:type II restriction endonuclease subunit M [Dactylosporangium sucinum]